MNTTTRTHNVELTPEERSALIQALRHRDHQGWSLYDKRSGRIAAHRSALAKLEAS